MAEVIVQPVNVTRMSSSWGIAKELQGATLGPPSLLPPSFGKPTRIAFPPCMPLHTR
jgi:hypothetical protein